MTIRNTSAQFATMQEMMDLCKYSKQNYVMSILGKEVTVSKNKIGGASEAITGIAEKILIENGEYKVYVDGKPYDFSKITQISAEPSGKEVDGSEEVGSEEKTDG